MRNMIKKSPWISIFNASSCNGCDLEVLALLTPKYDIERFGCVWKSSPRNADILIVTGPTNGQTKNRLKKIYSQMAPAKKVIALGTCGITGCVFRDYYNTRQKVDEVVPVDIYVPGCPPRPEAIINAVVKLLKKL
ncbi:NADH-quinone oxidoreductase subunit NuoB [Candidatus Woesearchaeota archaeon]|nr:NADH-quinone oxidoreductase subunit NuoB [Candidatus Woesearchaeota archaeon]